MDKMYHLVHQKAKKWNKLTLCSMTMTRRESAVQLVRLEYASRHTNDKSFLQSSRLKVLLLCCQTQMLQRKMRKQINKTSRKLFSDPLLVVN